MGMLNARPQVIGIRRKFRKPLGRYLIIMICKSSKFVIINNGNFFFFETFVDFHMKLKKRRPKNYQPTYSYHIFNKSSYFYLFTLIFVLFLLTFFSTEILSYKFYDILTVIKQPSLELVQQFKNQKMKTIKTTFSENPNPNTHKPKASARAKIFPQQQIVPCPPKRSTCVELLYRAEANLHFSRSTLFLSISMLDQLLVRGLSLTEETFEVVAGAILLVCTKFNEVYPVTVRKLNLLAQGEYTLQQYVEVESAILHALNFTIELHPTYEQLCALETSFEGRTVEKVRELVKLALLHPNQTFKNGAASLIMAVQQASEGELQERSSNNSNLGSQASEIRRELGRLANSRQLVSPCQC